uniref:Uncharacterized protein n=1 Tax=Vitrella brassicaformis TaxID=1169539 RepID=A0A7S1JIY0_9ALVE|mmetsp:Transcript_10422/g.25223  ORF Transcript_10422/g.25223 Transcript_10422/m.25223 type:complete len:116 (+) Transcript_10422:442-789(+)
MRLYRGRSTWPDWMFAPSQLSNAQLYRLSQYLKEDGEILDESAFSAAVERMANHVRLHKIIRAFNRGGPYYAKLMDTLPKSPTYETMFNFAEINKPKHHRAPSTETGEESPETKV